MPPPLDSLSSGPNRGLYRKYHVERVDRDSRHAACPYFVLDVAHDVLSWAALLVYADACEATLPGLAEDLRRLVLQYSPKDASNIVGQGIEMENVYHELLATRVEMAQLQKRLEEVREEGACRLQQQHADMRAADRSEL